MPAEMIQMLEGLNLRGLGTVPRPIRERFEPRARPGRLPLVPTPPGDRSKGSDPSRCVMGRGMGAIDTTETLKSIAKFGAITAAAGGVLYVGARLLRRRVRRRRR